MDKQQVLEMFEIMMKKMNEMDNKMTKGFAGVNSRIDGLKVEMNGRFDSVDEKLTGVGFQFEELSKNTIELREDINKELKYITHKIHALDREVFMRTETQ